MRTVCVAGVVQPDAQKEHQLSLYVRMGKTHARNRSHLTNAYDIIAGNWKNLTQFSPSEEPPIALPPRYEVSGKLLDDQIRIVVITPDKESAEVLGDRILARLSKNLEIHIYDYRYAQDAMRKGGGRMV